MYYNYKTTNTLLENSNSFLIGIRDEKNLLGNINFLGGCILKDALTSTYTTYDKIKEIFCQILDDNLSMQDIDLMKPGFKS